MHFTTDTPSKKTVVLGLLRLMRPKQWIKNTFVLAPLMFTGLFLDFHSVTQSLIVMILFCCASSATYILNDLHDIEADRKHPKKSKTRPLAQGIVKPAQGIMLLVVLYACLGLGFVFHPQSILVIAGYLVLNLAYSFVLKHQPVVDIFIIAIGFVLRTWAGAEALDVDLSSWMFVTTLSLALFLAAVKRRQELQLSGDQGRKVLEHYTVSLVERYAEMAATAALLFYSLFVMDKHEDMVLTIPFVLFGLFRYWFIVEANEEGESPTDALYSDWQLIVCILCWIGVSMWALWPSAISVAV
ncbi:decaprenyl-phosphate phosphoribosyltransferase [Marinicellulosiphila megalodicopiae]|uniref:decaprenyl-phosphate phosphoribosyltransferase n=1 Tax=Marinicellulosiphila megalodicopiae TaxID=2724896 RepID=UPI003BAF446F